MFEQNLFDEEFIFKKAIVYLGISAVILLILLYNNISLALGLACGGFASLINFRIMIHSVTQMINRGTVNRLKYSAYYILRMMVIIVVITAAIKLESINLVSAVIGLLWVKLTIYAEALIGSINNK